MAGTGTAAIAIRTAAAPACCTRAQQRSTQHCTLPAAETMTDVESLTCDHVLYLALISTFSVIFFGAILLVITLSIVACCSKTNDGNAPEKQSSRNDDGDGVADASDAYPLVSLGTLTDTDKDGLPNDCDAACTTAGMTADADDDGDKAKDADDWAPLDDSESLDTDGDGVGNNTDTDDDGDGVADADDLFPLIANVQKKGAAGRAGYTVPEQVKVLETK